MLKCTFSRGLIYAYKFRKACINADKVVAISECTKRDIIIFFHIPDEKIEVIYQSCDPAFALTISVKKKEEVKKKYRLPDQYILNVGSIEEKKNILAAVKKLPNLPTNIHLVIVGRRTAYTKQVEHVVRQSKLEDRVHIINNLPFDDLPTLYQGAIFFVYPSRFEGFGIPIIEALQSGIPVVTTTGSCLEEAGGPGSIYVHPDDVDEMTKAFTTILNDEKKREYMIAKGKEYANQFSEEKQARQLAGIYQNLVISSTQ